MAPTKDELEAENAELRDRVAALEEAADPVITPKPRTPYRPDYGLSAGEKDDLLSNGVTTSPFNGEQLNAFDELTAEECEGLTDRARANATKARTAKRQREALAAGPVPADNTLPAAAAGDQ